MTLTVAVAGASGFIGSACVEALTQAGFDVRPVPVPRIQTQARSLDALRAAVDPAHVRDLAEDSLIGADVLVNAAGQATATSTDLASLLGANTVLPLLLAKAATQAGVGRMVHVSSAAVQGRRVLDETESMVPQSPYALSKALAERLLREDSGTPVIRYRPTSVQGPRRRVTQSLVRLAESPAAFVAAPGNDPSPQTSADRVGNAVTILVNPMHTPPSIVMHPWEGTTTRSVLADLGGRSPRTLSRELARAAVRAAEATHRISRRNSGRARRLDLLLFGQGQMESWLNQHMEPADPGWLKRIRYECCRGEPL